MGRPGAVIEVDRNTPPVMFHFGEGVRLEKLPLGSRIVYPPDPLEPIAHPERAVKRALAIIDVQRKAHAIAKGDDTILAEMIDELAEAKLR